MYKIWKICQEIASAWHLLKKHRDVVSFQLERLDRCGNDVSLRRRLSDHLFDLAPVGLAGKGTTHHSDCTIHLSGMSGINLIFAWTITSMNFYINIVKEN